MHTSASVLRKYRSAGKVTTSWHHWKHAEGSRCPVTETCQVSTTMRAQVLTTMAHLLRVFSIEVFPNISLRSELAPYAPVYTLLVHSF